MVVNHCTWDYSHAHTPHDKSCKMILTSLELYNYLLTKLCMSPGRKKWSGLPVEVDQMLLMTPYHITEFLRIGRRPGRQK